MYEAKDEHEYNQACYDPERDEQPSLPFSVLLAISYLFPGELFGLFRSLVCHLASLSHETIVEQASYLLPQFHAKCV